MSLILKHLFDDNLPLTQTQARLNSSVLTGVHVESPAAYIIFRYHITDRLGE
jgi:hypothetical protein